MFIKVSQSVNTASAVEVFIPLLQSMKTEPGPHQCCVPLPMRGCVAVLVTFDGSYAKQKTLLNLGGSLKPDSINSIFPHPWLSEMSVATVFDPCHNIKLLRYLPSNEHEIINMPGIDKAKWQHLEMLHQLQLR